MTRMPQITSRELITFLIQQGFEIERQKGSHAIFVHRERNITISIPAHTGQDLGRGLAIRLLKDAGFSVDEFLRLR